MPTEKKQKKETGDKIKILFVVESFSTGVYSIVHDIACNLDPKRFSVLIVHSFRSDSPKTYREDFNQSSVQLQYVPMDSIASYKSAIKTLRQLFKEFDPEVVHLHSSIAGGLGRIAVRHHFKGKVFYSPHGFSFLKRDVSKGKRWAFRTAERLLALYGGGTVLAISESEYLAAKKITSHVVQVNNFVNLREIPEEKNTDKVTVVTSGRVSEQKNPLLFNQIALAFPETQFIWVGDGPLKSSLSAPNIILTGYVSRKIAMEKVSESTIYLQTSLWEGLSVSLLEAMAMGKPVIASDVEGNHEAVRIGETGYLCPVTSPDVFIREIQHLLEDRALASRLGTCGKTYVKNLYDLDMAILQYENIYSSGLQH